MQKLTTKDSQELAQIPEEAVGMLERTLSTKSIRTAFRPINKALNASAEKYPHIKHNFKAERVVREGFR